MRTWKNPHVQRLLIVLCMVALILCHNHLQQWRNEQLELFNEGLAAYKAGDMVTAVQQFDDSIEVYINREANDSLVERIMFGQPDRLVAARAAFQKGKALVALTQSDAALAAYTQSLTLNPGSGFAGSSLLEARVTQYDLELLFAGNESLAKQEGVAQKPGTDNNQPPPGLGPPQQPGTDDATQF